MKTVRQLLDSKPIGVVTIDPYTPVFDALARMADHEIGALVVVENGRVVGILSERDYARKVILHNKHSREIPVKEIMTDRVFYVSPDNTLADCMTLMTDRRVRHLPVLERDELVGVLSIGDLVKATIAEHEYTIRQLETYIMS
jgi:CBS domain-containing protein